MTEVVDEMTWRGKMLVKLRPIQEKGRRSSRPSTRMDQSAAARKSIKRAESAAYSVVFVRVTEVPGV